MISCGAQYSFLRRRVASHTQAAATAMLHFATHQKLNRSQHANFLNLNLSPT